MLEVLCRDTGFSMGAVALYAGGRVRILRVLASLDPRGGGPIEAARQLDIELTRQGHLIEVVCLNGQNDVFLADYPVQVHALGPTRSGYRYSPRLVPWLKENCSLYDAVIVDGLWQYHSLAVYRALRGRATPYVIYSHGMLAHWFKRRHPLKHAKKWLYWPWAEYRVLKGAARVLFTSDEERLSARRSFWLYECNECVAPLGVPDAGTQVAVAKANFENTYPSTVGKTTILFLGRISEIKGCDLLLTAFSRVCERDSTLHLVMAGPDQDGYMTKLKRLSLDLGISPRVTWTGMLSGDEKWGALAAASVFCLPSHHENFGVAVVEALSVGKAVLISDKVNIWRDIVADGGAFVSDDTSDSVFEMLSRWVDLPERARNEMGLRALSCYRSRYTIENSAQVLSSVIMSIRP